MKMCEGTTDSITKKTRGVMEMHSEIEMIRGKNNKDGKNPSKDNNQKRECSTSPLCIHKRYRLNTLLSCHTNQQCTHTTTNANKKRDREKRERHKKNTNINR